MPRSKQPKPEGTLLPSPDFNAALQTLYAEALTSRNRLALLSPPTRQDLEQSQMALHEVVWMLMTPPKQAKTSLALPEAVKKGLRTRAEDRDNDLYAALIALVALKLATESDGRLSLAATLDALTDLLDTLTFDHRRPKRAILETLRQLKDDIDARLAYVAQARSKGFRFPERIERYAERTDRSEKPDQFFRRVYARFVPQGLTQADMRREDPAFYNVFHVWCSRNHKRPESYLPSARPRRS